ncbi:hypothetical protein D770_22590 [Flammeovirgaceae bacterium 311]|nr:hypothetical protein D770_22590 [Flammeovirgaceae bacterium 311]
MVEVFKTNVSSPDQANRLLVQIHNTFIHYRANFDLWDCDHILRVKSTNGSIQPLPLILLLKKNGFRAEVLPDDPPVAGRQQMLLSR